VEFLSLYTITQELNRYIVPLDARCPGPIMCASRCWTMWNRLEFPVVSLSDALLCTFSQFQLPWHSVTAESECLSVLCDSNQTEPKLHIWPVYAPKLKLNFGPTLAATFVTFIMLPCTLFSWKMINRLSEKSSPFLCYVHVTVLPFCLGLPYLVRNCRFLHHISW